ncbi:type II secretion system protein [uncultured Ruminococcus sp.]|mgnify:FL=1|uniref:type II secretion system protein n=1 Tax=uncultured Ruminococcus sp. TaxID=165186 RepID=UPI002666CA39|nr:type II secretion system protein [uncultured Ruminococcus sp.]
MKTPMNVFNTAMKKKKNRKGFSLVELIVVLVIMAILAAALIPTLIGYIKQTRQSNYKNECASAVSAAQTIISSAYADSNSTYINQTDAGNNVKISGNSLVGDPSSVDANQVVKVLAEVPGTIQGITLLDGQLTQLQYIPEGKSESDGDCVTYSASKVNGVYKGSYTVGAIGG